MLVLHLLSIPAPGCSQLGHLHHDDVTILSFELTSAIALCCHVHCVSRAHIVHLPSSHNTPHQTSRTDTLVQLLHHVPTSHHSRQRYRAVFSSIQHQPGRSQGHHRHHQGNCTERRQQGLYVTVYQSEATTDLSQLNSQTRLQRTLALPAMRQRQRQMNLQERHQSRAMSPQARLKALHTS